MSGLYEKPNSTHFRRVSMTDSIGVFGNVKEYFLSSTEVCAVRVNVVNPKRHT